MLLWLGALILVSSLDIGQAGGYGPGCNLYPCVNGNCRDTVNLVTGYICSCHDGWTGRNCDVQVCKFNYCYNGATCSSAGHGHACICTEQWKGPTCQMFNCTSSTCDNGGTCHEMGADFRCDCAPGWQGPTCQFPVTNPVAITNEPITKCHDMWVAFHGSCYLFGNKPATFTEAENYCIQNGGRLVHVNSIVENAFLKDKMRYLNSTSWWLGLADDQIETIWQWTDDMSMATFTDWFSGQPDDHQHQEDCAVFDNSTAADFRWSDMPCHDQFLPVCEEAPGRCATD